jgi:hypothetical protein
LGSPEKEEEEELELPFRWRGGEGYKNSMGLVKKETLISFSFKLLFNVKAI